ncbi:helix-turn-helix transcriptional regulator [Nocardia higoensis]|uniref:Helix-turn-helix transcriptional regulator n=1 Tax=Nocardia higoensis TaxID=228599 RepID=A0ABS0D8B2_9NOCA|nr:LuxR C-terminal-related transcriptional regulator [Nocardia higoensis]MBF6354706.1 helix-turn-helix transcriptional regulator [Nocardia higoensis]
MTGTPLLRPRDGDALRAEVRWVARETAAPIVFGGEIHDDTLLLSEFVGTKTTGLRGLPVLRNSGLGGRVMDVGRPISLADYRNAASITHHYDEPVTGEGIRSVFAVPVMVGEQSRAVLYAATRGGPLGDRTAELMVRASRRLAGEIAVRDEVDRRLRMLDVLSPAHTAGPEMLEELRGIHADLRGLASVVGDEPTRRRLYEMSARLVRVLSGERAADPSAVPTLSRRELDVLSEVALGCTNSEVARRLSLQPETVKSYLRNAMTKLDAHSRHEAVVIARRLGLLI